MTPLRVFIGYDSRETVAYHALAHSILRYASVPVAITPLVIGQLRAVYTRTRGPTESTEFSMTRFLVPWLSGYEGVSLFLDCDMLCKVDIAELFAARDPAKAVSVCQHNYVPRSAVKFLGQEQTSYPRKNWSSLMLFDNAKCTALTPEYVNTASGLELHRLLWTKDELVGALPLEWNWLVGEYPPNDKTKILHYTNGGPWFDGYRGCDHAMDWFLELEKVMSPARVTISLQAR